MDQGYDDQWGQQRPREEWPPRDDRQPRYDEERPREERRQRDDRDERRRRDYEEPRRREYDDERDYDRRRRREYDDRDDRRRDDRDERRRDDRDERRPRRSGFADGPPPGVSVMPGQPGMPQPGMLMPGYGAPMVPNRPNMPVPLSSGINPKKQRELYIGNVPTGAVTEPMIKELFSQILQQCEGFDGSTGAPVLNVQLRGGGAAAGGGTGTTFAFVEFRDETLSATIATFNGMELYGRNLKISHPNGYVAPDVPVKTLGIPEDIMKRFGLGSYEAMRRQDKPPQELADRKARELYVGNLTIGMVTSAMLIELFTYPLQKLPLGDDGAGVACPVVEAKVDQSGKFAFVLFADDQIATMALAIFNKMELCGRPLCVDRPAGYTTDMSRPLPPGMLENGMPSGGTGAPPDKAARAAAQTAAITRNVPGTGGAAGLEAPSRMLCLKNLLGPEALQDETEFKECTDDIREECTNFGTVVSFAAPRAGDLAGYSDADVGSCFVMYELMSAAVRAQSDLDGREFDGRRVIATFMHVAGAE